MVVQPLLRRQVAQGAKFYTLIRYGSCPVSEHEPSTWA